MPKNAMEVAEINHVLGWDVAFEPSSTFFTNDTVPPTPDTQPKCMSRQE